MSGQSNKISTIGRISYITSSNAYVKFDNTNIVNVGDTLFSQKNSTLSPILVINAKSSTSCVGTILPGIILKENQEVIHFGYLDENKLEDNPSTAISTILPVTYDSTSQTPITPKAKTDVSGRITLANYSNFSSNNTSNHRQFAALALILKILEPLDCRL